MVYSDIVNNNLILPKKEKYTMRDFKKLVNSGHTQLQARFIVICSSIYYHEYEPGHISNKFMTEQFTIACRYGRAI